MIVIQGLNHGLANEAPYGNLIDDILIHTSHLSCFEFYHVKCSCNRVVDAIAKKAKSGLEFQAWIQDLPDDITPWLSLMSINSCFFLVFVSNKAPGC